MKIPALLSLLILTPALLADAPTLDALKDISQETKTDIKLTVAAKSDDGPLRYSIARVRKDGKDVATPKGMVLPADTGAFAWTPTPSQAGVYEVTFAVKDAKDRESTAALKITVRERPISIGQGAVGDLLRKWYAEGTAAGNTGDFYDNRDRDHSALNLAPFPQLDVITYTAEERKKYLDWALATVVRPGVTFGNSSTSAGPTNGGSNVRSYYVHPRGLEFLYTHYRGNNVYMYPAHHDHHPGHNGRPFYGDLYPANSPYLVTSQGSSGSDQPFMRAVPLTLAAFRPEVKKKLIETGLVMPTVQMILRSTNKHLADPKEYLTGKAHPPVFEGSWVNDLKMVQLAHDITLDTIPPLVQLKVVEEDVPVRGKDYFEIDLTEKVCDSPCAIARVIRGDKYVRRMVVSAEDSLDVNKKPLKYHWAVLRGDRQRIKIKPLNEAGSIVELLVPYHGRRTDPEAPLKIDSNRVDIGAFVHNGTYYSAPGFVSFFSLDHEARTYDDKGRLLEIGHGAGETEFHVTDWNGLFALLKDNGELLPFDARLLQQGFTAAERAALAKAGDEYKVAAETQAKAQQQHKETTTQHQTTVKRAKDAEGAVKAAQKAVDADASDKNKAELERAKEELEKAVQVRDLAEQLIKITQKQLDEANKAVNDVLTKQRPGLKQPVRDAVNLALDHLKVDANFSLTHRTDLETLLRVAPEAQKARFLAARKRLVEFDILRGGESAWQLHSIREGNGPVGERLTPFEKGLLERFHAEVITTLVYPKVLRYEFKVNLVDFRLATLKNWRDLYRYDTAGRRLGWVRQDGSGEQEFNADGHVILEKDARGRAVKARTVKYEAEGKGPALRTLRQGWGDEVVFYEYDGDDDFRGKITRREKVAEKR